MTDPDLASLFPFDRSAFSVGHLDDGFVEDIWLSRSKPVRLAGIEFLRQQFYGDSTSQPPFQRILEFARRT